MAGQDSGDVEGVNMILDVTREPEALSAAFVYAALKGYGPGSDLYEALNDSMGFYPVALVLKRKSDNDAGSVPVGEAASAG